MLRFYLVILIVLAAAPARAQTPAPAQPSQIRPPLASTLDADLLRDLPIASSPLAVLETIQPEAIGDRFTAGGLNAAGAPRVGAFLNSWTQTEFRIGDIRITDPRAGGTPLLLPPLSMWQRMTIAAGAMGVDEGAPALSATLEPRRPGTKWFRVAEGSLSASPLVSGTIGAVPVVDRVDQWQDGNVLVSGPVTPRLGLVAAGSVRGLSHAASPATLATSDSVVSGFAHLVFAATARDELRAIGWVQRVSSGSITDTALHLQSTWERRESTQVPWRVFGAYTERSRTNASPAATLIVDSLNIDPVSDLIDSGPDTARRWTVGARVTPRSQQLPAVGFDLDGAEVRIAPSGIQQIRELVDRTPARAWTLHAGNGVDVRHATMFAAFGNEHLTFGRLALDAGLRVESLTAAADASPSGIQWTTWLPRAMLRYQVADTPDLAAIVGYRRSAYQLPLNVLAVGDPAAPVADVATWNGTTTGPLVARVGPGTGGDAAFSQIDPRLERPTTDELVLAVQARPVKGVDIELARVAKREQPLLGFTDTGIDPAAYSSFRVADTSFLSSSPVGAPQVTVFNRPPGIYGRDRYLLTNRAGEPAKSWALELTVRATTERFTLLFGGNLTWALGPAAAIGFLPTQNDQDVLGSLFVDPNAATEARSQLFQDRSHVAKIAGVVRLPSRIRVGAILRYQDGQPFARLVVVPNLTQGAMPVRDYANGGSAFSYIGTLDARLQKTFTSGRSEIAALIDVYNVPNLGNEVTEKIVSGPAFRTPTALQPPRTVLAGLRVTF